MRICKVTLSKLNRECTTYKFKLPYVKLTHFRIYCQKCNYYKKLNLINKNCFCKNLTYEICDKRRVWAYIDL